MHYDDRYIAVKNVWNYDKKVLAFYHAKMAEKLLPERFWVKQLVLKTIIRLGMMLHCLH